MNLTIPKNGCIAIDGVTYYATDAAEISVSTEQPKTEQELAREWWGRLAPRGKDRWYVTAGGDVGEGPGCFATDAANSWPSQAIAERRAKQITAQNLLILAAMECRSKHDKANYCSAIDFTVSGKSHVFERDVLYAGQPTFHCVACATEAMNHLRALGLLQHLLLDMGEQHDGK